MRTRPNGAPLSKFRGHRVKHFRIEIHHIVNVTKRFEVRSTKPHNELVRVFIILLHSSAQLMSKIFVSRGVEIILPIPRLQYTTKLRSNLFGPDYSKSYFMAFRSEHKNI